MKNMKPTRKNAIRSFCHECMGYYSDGDRDCKNNKCSLYSFIKHHKMEPDFDWTKFNPARAGQVFLEDCDSRTVSKSTLDALKRSRR